MGFLPLSDSENRFFEYILELNNKYGLGQLPLVQEEVSVLFFSRVFFFVSIKKFAPEVVEDLHKTCFAEFSQAFPAYSAWYTKRYSHAPKTFLTGPKYCHWATLLEAGQEEGPLKPLIHSLERWSAQHHLNDTWVLDTATVLLSFWFHHPQYETIRAWFYPGTQYYKGENLHTEAWIFEYPRYSSQAKPTFCEEGEDPLVQQAMEIWWENQPPIYDPPIPTLPPFEPQIETEKEYKARIAPIIDAYIERSLERAAQEGFKQPPKKRKLEEHFAWLVQYQIQGWAQSQIADTYSEKTKRTLGEDAIGKAVRKAANLVKLTLREPESGGRPKTRPS